MTFITNKGKRTTGIYLQYLYSLLNMICGLFISAYLLRVLGDTEYGIYQTISSFVNSLVLLEFGTGTVMIRNTSACIAMNDTEGIKKNISTIWTITCILAVLITLVGTVFFVLLDKIYSATFTEPQIVYAKYMFVVLLAYLVASFLTNTLYGALLAFEKYEIKPATEIVRFLVRTLLLVVLLLSIRKSIIIALVDLGLAISIDVFLIVYCRKKVNIRFNFRDYDSSVFRKSLPLASAILIQSLVNQANNNVDKFVIGIKLGPEEVTVYSVGLYIFSVFSSLTSIPIGMYGPQVVKDVSLGLKPNEVANRLINPSRVIVLIGGTILFGFFAVGKQFISLVYGEAYIIAWTVAMIIMIPMLINMSNGIMINILDATDKRMTRSTILMVTTIANIVLTVIWIDKYRILGACIATAICTLFGQILMMDLYYKYKLKIGVFVFKLKTFKGIIVFQLIASLVAYIIARGFSNSLVSFLIGGTTYVIIFLCLFMLFGASDYEKKLIIGIVNKIRKTVYKT